MSTELGLEAGSLLEPGWCLVSQAQVLKFDEAVVDTQEESQDKAKLEAGSQEGTRE